jgi:Na+-driven multidrug efflux pump
VFRSNIKERYMALGGYGEFFKIAIPVIISSYVVAIEVFADRVLLSMYSQVSYAASIPAGLSNSTLEFLFLFTVAYVDVFIAQYYGKKEYSSIGPAVWQSIYFAIAAAVILLAFVPLSGKIFMGIGHANDIAIEEIKYFNMLCYGAFFPMVSIAFSGFYSGRGKAYVILLVSICGVMSNIIFDAANLTFQFAIKGAGDTAFVMKVFVVLSIILVIIPTYLIINVFKMGIYVAWFVTIGYVLALSVIFYFGYKSGKWKQMRVIDMKVING